MGTGSGRRTLKDEGTDMKLIRKLLVDSKGATAIEYGLIAALIAVAMITAVRSAGTKVGGTFNVVSGNMNG